jgi:hypothetical protein
MEGRWKGSECGEEREKSAVEEEIEIRLVKKLQIVQSLETEDFDKMMNVAEPVMNEVLRTLGTKHFAGQQALLLKLVAQVNKLVNKQEQELSTNVPEMIDTIEEIISFGLETELPLMGVLDIAQIVLSPALVHIMTSLFSKDHQHMHACARKFENIFLLCLGAVQTYNDQDDKFTAHILRLWVHLKQKVEQPNPEPLSDPVQTPTLEDRDELQPAVTAVSQAALGGQEAKKESDMSKTFSIAVSIATFAAVGVALWRRYKK